MKRIMLSIDGGLFIGWHINRVAY